MLNTMKPDGAEQGLGNPSTGSSPEHAPPFSEQCPHCLGRGRRELTISTMRGPDIKEMGMCPDCNGYGHRPAQSNLSGDRLNAGVIDIGTAAEVQGLT